MKPLTEMTRDEAQAAFATQDDDGDLVICGYCEGAGGFIGNCPSGQDDWDCSRCEGRGILDYECASFEDEQDAEREWRDEKLEELHANW